MKIVIDIPEVMYTACSGSNITPLTNMESCLISYVGGGQPLDNILEEITAEIAGTEYHFIDGEAMVKVNKVFDIIEKKQEVDHGE